MARQNMSQSGSEISKDGTYIRPVLVVSTRLGGDLVFVIPCTTQYKDDLARFLIPLQNATRYGLDRDTYLCMNHIKTMSIRRLVRQVNNISVHGKHIPRVPNAALKKLVHTIVDILM
jgi:mRNA-degrading endonuclease toxin of MazEF toxin-antitoxin module